MRHGLLLRVRSDRVIYIATVVYSLFHAVRVGHKLQVAQYFWFAALDVTSDSGIGQ